MNVITKLMYSIHRILGTLLCILFLMWFLSAFVMMYHRFPRVSAKEKMQKLEMLSQAGDSLPDISSVTARLPRGVKVRSTILNLNAGHPEFSFSTTKGTFHFLADSTISRPSLDSEHLHRTAALWCSSPITRIDTLHSLDQWIPFAELKKEMPIYKIYFADDAGTQLYLSSQNGEALQFSNRSERFWAWLGAIPHWVYFTWLRQDTVLWTKTVIWLTALGCLMVIAGIWVTVDVWRKTHRNRRIIAAYPQALQIEWRNFREHPYYIVKDSKNEYYIDATDSLPRPLQLSEEEILKGVESIYASRRDSSQHIPGIRISRLEHFETYYRDMSNMYRGRPQLPVWKITVDDPDRSVYYIHPETGIIRHTDTSSRWKYWSYTALHRMRLPGLNSNATLRKTVLWVLLLGGTAVCITGVALSVNYIRRKCCKRQKLY